MNFKKIKKVGVIGVGFMGGSLALALKKNFNNFEIIGHARSSRSFKRLKKAGVVDKIERSEKEIAAQADLLILATPVSAIVNLLKKLGPCLKEGAVVIDLGSTKEKIEKTAKMSFSKGAFFVGCHPLCGSEKKGVEAAKKGLYERSLCFITSNNKAAPLVEKIWKKIGAKVIKVNPKTHDKITCFISHLPHLISFSLINAVPDRYLEFSSSGFRDFTRIASSPDNLWADIFLTNKNEILDNIDKYNKLTEKFKELIEKEDKQGLQNLIKKANKKRNKIS